MPGFLTKWNKYNIMFNEMIRRTVAKTITSRILLGASQILTGMFVTNSLETGILFAIGALTVNVLILFGFERAWNWSGYGQRLNEATLFIDSWSRTIYKAVTWRLCITANNFLIPYLLKGSFEKAMMFLSISSIVNTVLYFLHDRTWNKVRWGRNIIVDKLPG